MNITSLDQLAKILEAKINASLKTNVSEVVKEEMSKTIKEKTYKQYIPGEYIRREDEDGLSDIRNMDTTVIDKNTISIRNMTTGNEAYSDSDGWDSGLIDGIIVSGRGYHWRRSEIYGSEMSGDPIERDFYSETVDSLKSSDKHVIAMKKGLQSEGLITI